MLPIVEGVSDGRVTSAVRTTEVPIVPRDTHELGPIIGPGRLAAVLTAGHRARQALSGRTVMHVNSTATGGGVAEMLPTLLGYTAGAGVQVRWFVLRGDPAFFAVTKRLHNRLHGYCGDDGDLGTTARAAYERILLDAATDMLQVLEPGDIAVLHDPQALGLAPLLRRRGVTPIWRCHIGTDTADAITADAWTFLTPYLDDVAAFVFSRASYRPARIPVDLTWVITPSIDPLSTKNRPLDTTAVSDILVYTGLLGGSPALPPMFSRRDGSAARLERRAEVVQLGPPPSPREPVVVQVSRWDRLKDMIGVMTGFAEYIATTGSGHLILAGPNASGVSDDPEGAAQFASCVQEWRGLPERHRRRIHLASLPVVDAEENALIVNAVQRHAAVVVQKSLAEGFGLTVLEAMWKGRPVVASAVGGIRDQIADERYGLLLPDPHDLATFGALVRRLLDNPAMASSIGQRAAVRAADFLPDRHLIAWAELLIDVTAC
ncbi:trehalose synthase [Nakamurella sp. UYEF19]|uniref:glycosyltransferase n=1 Tax=Nakamurella sp. UYEF19 TaxID=1756392 RepID=UPI00339730A8